MNILIWIMNLSVLQEISDSFVSKKTSCAEDKKKEEHWQDEKFLYKENFGETLNKKGTPAIFIFDLTENKLS